MDIRKFLVKFFQIIFWKLAVSAQARASNRYLSYRYKYSTPHLLFHAEVRSPQNRSDGGNFAPTRRCIDRPWPLAGSGPGADALRWTEGSITPGCPSLAMD